VSALSLSEYSRKRDFRKTREPKPEQSASPGNRAIFVVQLHHASSRHFDFRLQVGDTLKSWAVPKGPSFDPSVKRLAVEVEDHPISYAAFEGDIAEGYGKGHVDQFDKGVWATQGDAEAQLEKGHLEFELFGERLKGGWHLVRSGRKERQPAWFLIKTKDGFASDLEADDLLDKKMTKSTQKAASSRSKSASSTRPPPKPKKPASTSAAKTRAAKRTRLAGYAAKMPGAQKKTLDGDFFKPELARLRETPLVGDEWLHEVKWDGYRIVTTIAKGLVHLWSRNGLPWNERLPEIVRAVAELGLQSGQLDGELIALDKSGRTDFNGLQRTLSGEAQLPLVYVLFDLPSLEGFDLRRCSLVDRKALLAKVLKSAPGQLSYSSHTIGDGQAAFDMATREKLEGIVSKRTDSGYREGRGDDWVKVKRLESDEFAVVGYTHPKGARSGFGSLLLAKPDPDDSKGWTYVGRVGSGFTDAQLVDISQALANNGTKNPSFKLSAVDPQLRGALWIKPKAVVEVNYRGIGNHHLLRQPTLKTLRSDKSVADLRNSDRASTTTPKFNAPRSKKGAADPVITITHPDRVVFADDAISKQDVADYYTAVMDWFLPGVVDRPTSVIRCPEGTAKACFFQKHVIQGLHHVGTAKLKEETGAQAVYIYPKDAVSILELVQFGALEFHPWGSTVDKPDQADRIVFDLDPGEKVTWARVVAAARLLRKLLQQLGLESFVRTTGGKGLHVVVPLKPSHPWPMVRRFAEAFARSLAQAHPLEFVATATKSKRGGKIYLDYLRNTKGATSVASYSLRARPGAPVATPLRWEELGKVKSGDAFTIKTLPGRLSKLRTDPWEKLDSTKQDLKHLMKALTKKGQN
jgi:bifunctional non-homologous end joining protein LigD